ncbi:hypothetical protein GYMLUDRAFT_251175 [Collybiopsis luxurians FD-317 M1]|uniref:UBC core domain-containing protein n=1 Tax=Collybiopsis luxurians FD-317 M1 TaxID=944289 RepID=A0A0D0BS82_9AGAR|nr:hypothetical protein GYMLUDRAFT_251175 [Collybiopsis luxurians FD-317 M1]
MAIFGSTSKEDIDFVLGHPSGLETVLNSGERPRPTTVMTFVQSLFSRTSIYGDKRRYPVDVVTLDQFPQRAEHVKLYNKVKLLNLLTNRLRRIRDDRLKRIMLEIFVLKKKTPDYVDLYVDDSDITFLRIVMEAPKDQDCLYRSGVYFLTCEFPEGFSRDSPQICFVSFIMHPNVYKQEKVCSLFCQLCYHLEDDDVNRSAAGVSDIHTHPDLENPLGTQASIRRQWYVYAVVKAVSTHASKTQADWGAELEDE